MSEYVVAMEGITKTFPGVRALDDVHLHVRPGEIHALVGENGAGKSTLMKCLNGIYRPNAGRILWEGKEITLRSPLDALQTGISMIHQELSPVLERSVMHNIWLGREPVNRLHMVDHKEMYRRTVELLEYLGLSIDPWQTVGQLTVAKMQMVEIAKALSYNAKVIVMDEPTSALTAREAEYLFAIIRKLKENGVAIIYISHKTEEIFSIADTITIMRDGRHVETRAARDMTPQEMITRMVGHEVSQMFPKIPVELGETRLVVRGLTCEGYCRDISFELHRGEILGVAGLVGAGRTELMEALFGIRRKASGEVLLDGKPLHIRRPSDAIQAGLAFLTEDRRATGIFPMMDISQNIALAARDRYAGPTGMLRLHAIQKDAQDYVERLRIKTPGLHTLIQFLSGSNQQKVLIARWLLTEPDILILDEPTRGIDVGAKSEIHSIITKMAAQGKSIILISSEMPEIIGMSDRVMVMHEGKKTGELVRKDFSQEAIMQLAIG